MRILEVGAAHDHLDRQPRWMHGATFCSRLAVCAGTIDLPSAPTLAVSTCSSVRGARSSRAGRESRSELSPPWPQRRLARCCCHFTQTSCGCSWLRGARWRCCWAWRARSPTQVRVVQGCSYANEPVAVSIKASAGPGRCMPDALPQPPLGGCSTAAGRQLKHGLLVGRYIVCEHNGSRRLACVHHAVGRGGEAVLIVPVRQAAPMSSIILPLRQRLDMGHARSHEAPSLTFAGGRWRQGR